MKININTIEDDLEGKWWLHIHSSNFGFQGRISDLNSHEISVDDILIHKQIKEGDRFPTIRYHKVLDKGTSRVENDAVKELLASKLVDYVRKHKKLPYSCKVAKFFSNGSAQINYKPTDYDSFALKIVPKVHGVNNTEVFFKNLTSSENPIKVEPKAPSKAPGKQWEIPSSTDPNKKYTVTYTEDGNWTCTCPQFAFRRAECKHIKECKKKL
jgi:hypothetical protein